MKTRDRRPVGSFSRYLAPVLIPGILGCILTILVVAVPAGIATPSSHATTSVYPPLSTLPELVRRRDLDSGRSRHVDLRALARKYAELKAKLSRSLSQVEAEFPKKLKASHDAGLRSCRGRSTREVRLKNPLPRELRGRWIYFAQCPRTGPLRLPPQIAKDPRAEILILKTHELGRLGDVSQQLKRRVSLASGDVAKALGVRCTNTMVEIKENGRVLVIREGR